MLTGWRTARERLFRTKARTTIQNGKAATMQRLHNSLKLASYPPCGATWRSGDAADCKSAYPGSIPGVASNLRAFGASAGRRILAKVAHRGSRERRAAASEAALQRRQAFVIAPPLSRWRRSLVAQR